jgi:hydrogenase maturation protease
MSAPVLIFAIGNESRGDDGLAPLLLRKIERWLQTSGIDKDKFELIEAFQLQIEDTLDMQGRELILFVDAGIETPAPFSFVRAEATATPNLFSHALTPDSLLALYLQIHHEAAPAAFILCLRGEQFELGAELSAAAASRMDQAMEFMQGLLQQAEVRSWDTQALLFHTLEDKSAVSLNKEIFV